MLHISLLGPVEITHDGCLLPSFPTKKAMSLFGYLVTHPGKTLYRDYLAELFWPDRNEENTRRSLHTALWQIRSTLKACQVQTEQYLLTTNHSVTWVKNAGDWLDVEAFEAAYNSPDIQEQTQAARLYRGSLLAHLDDDWCIEMRSLLEIHYLDTLKNLVEHCFTVKDHMSAVEYARQMVSVDPLNEDANRAILFALHHLGNRTGVIEHYRWFAQILKQELGITPGEQTRQLFQQIIDGVIPSDTRSTTLASSGPLVSAAPAASAPDPAPAALLSPDITVFERALFICREQEMRALDNWWTQPGELVAQIKGIQYSGKTRLLQEYAALVKTEGTLVSWGRCFPFSQALPFQVVREALRTLLETVPQPVRDAIPGPVVSELVKFSPDLADMPGLPTGKKTQPAASSHPFLAFSSLLTALAQHSPVLLVIDDVNWMDASTQHLLEYLVRRLQGETSVGRSPVRILMSVNSDIDLPGSILSMNARLRRDGLIKDISLQDLDLGAVEEWLSLWCGPVAHTQALAAQLYRQVGGNPFFIVETVKAGLSSGDLRLTACGWEGPAVEQGVFPVAGAIRALIEERMSGLTPLARQVIDAAAMTGLSFNPEVLLQAVPVDEETLLQALEVLLKARLVRGPDEDTAATLDFRFPNPLFRQEILSQVDPARRAMVWRRIQPRPLPASSRPGKMPASQLPTSFSA